MMEFNQISYTSLSGSEHIVCCLTPIWPLTDLAHFLSMKCTYTSNAAHYIYNVQAESTY